MNENLYMVIDVTALNTTQIVFIGSNNASIEFVNTNKKLYKACKLIAPPIAGRSFSKFEKLNLQYLFWNTFNETPLEDYAELVKKCIEKTLVLKISK